MIFLFEIPIKNIKDAKGWILIFNLNIMFIKRIERKINDDKKNIFFICYIVVVKYNEMWYCVKNMSQPKKIYPVSLNLYFLDYLLSMIY